MPKIAVNRCVSESSNCKFIATHLDKFVGINARKTYFSQSFISPTVKPVETGTLGEHVHHGRLCDDIYQFALPKIYNRETSYAVLGQQQQHCKKWVWCLQCQKRGPPERSGYISHLKKKREIFVFLLHTLCSNQDPKAKSLLVSIIVNLCPSSQTNSKRDRTGMTNNPAKSL